MECTGKINMSGSIRSAFHTVLGFLICIILIPLLIINITLITRSFTNRSESPEIAGYSPLIVLSDSMKPTIDKGDLIILQYRNADTIEVDDVIAFSDSENGENNVLVHRVTEIIDENGALFFRTKGDANAKEDKMLVSAEKIVGVYQIKIKKAGNVAMFMQTTIGFILCVILPIIILIGCDIIRRKRIEKNNSKNTSALLAELEEIKKEKNQKKFNHKKIRRKES
jgi:signal peptidase